ncbi:MAG: hypothetical protein RML36_03890 [Anaerolineae bacterium]|nr:hypothetical protein [Anaerolineae bacterium]MDW8098611.1 hypothetical protein [Anaerolineae bacterium]
MNLKCKWWSAWVCVIALGLASCAPPTLVLPVQTAAPPKPTLTATATSVSAARSLQGQLAWEVPVIEFATPMPGLAAAAFKSSVTL